MTTLTPRPLRAPAHTLADVLAATCHVLGITDDDMRSGRRGDVATAREVFVVVARRNTCASFPDIARATGRASHSGLHMAHARFVARANEPTAWGHTRAQLAAEIVSELGEK